MSVKIRLARRGRKKLAMFDVVIADARAPRDGRFIEKIGTYNPNVNPAFININEQKALDWIMKGAQPTNTARAILSERGVMFKKHLQVGVNKGAITQDQADKKFEDWFKDKEKQNQEILNKLTEASKRLEKTKFEAEKKVNENRAAAIMKKKQAAEAALVAEIAEEEVTATEKEIVEEVEETISKSKGPEKVKGVKLEEVKAKETKAEEAKAEEAKAEEAKAEEAKAEEAKVEEVKVEETKAEEAKVEEVKAEEAKVEEVKAEEAKVEEVKAEEAKVKKVKVEEAKVEEVKVEETKVDKTEGNDKRAESSEEISK